MCHVLYNRHVVTSPKNAELQQKHKNGAMNGQVDVLLVWEKGTHKKSIDPHPIRQTSCFFVFITFSLHKTYCVATDGRKKTCG